MASTTFVLFASARAVSGLFSASSIPAAQDLANLRSLLPQQRTPVIDDNKCMTASWYRFTDFLVNRFLGGLTGATLPDVASSVTYAEAQSIAIAAATAAMQQWTAANAQATDAIRQVVQAAALPGATQIRLYS
jgi:hypothetical protein